MALRAGLNTPVSTRSSPSAVLPWEHVRGPRGPYCRSDSKTVIHPVTCVLGWQPTYHLEQLWIRPPDAEA